MKKPEQSSPLVKQIMALAERQARNLNHQYVGTEHVLLALLEQGQNVAASVLRTLEIDASKVRAEIEKMLARGRIPVSIDPLLLTPRAGRAVDLALEEAKLFDRTIIEPETLLLGLLREESGVAGIVLRNLGLDLVRARSEVLKIRFLQMKVVEKVVRSVKASMARKRRMRKELLVHLETIYEEEMARLGDPVAAVREASARFGDPVELARELESALPGHERWTYYCERFFAYRFPESAAKYALRQTRQVMVIWIALIGLLSVMSLFLDGWNWADQRVLGSMLLFIAAVQLAIGLLYFKARDALLGPVWSRRSWASAFVCLLLMAAVVFVGAFGFVAVNNGLGFAVYCAKFLAAIGVVSAIGLGGLTRLRGPTEIADTLWASLDV